MPKPDTSPPRGTRDLLPDEVALREWAAARIQAAYARYGFRRVETPAMEDLARLTGGQGGENEKLIFKILKRGGKLDLSAAEGEGDLADLGLRYDLTVPLARFYAEHRGALGSPFKAIQIGPVWRAERPQRGRYRQFTQCDIDVLGDPSVTAEIELIEATLEALASLGFEQLVVRVNDRRVLQAIVEQCGFRQQEAGSALVAVDKLDKIGSDGVAKELLGHGCDEAAVTTLLDFMKLAPTDLMAAAQLVRSKADQRIANLAAKQNADQKARVERLRDGADAGIEALDLIVDPLQEVLPAKCSIVRDPTLVRGMGYYTGPIFEIALEGVPYSLGGGGRYDRMIGDMIGGEVPACGFSIGFERVVLELQQRGLGGEARAPLAALLHDPKRDDPLAVAAAARQWRGQGTAVTVLPKRKKLGAQLDELAAAGVTRFWVFEEGALPTPKDLAEPSAR